MQRKAGAYPVNCKNCGERMEGDGYKYALHCPNAEYGLIDDLEPDANPVHCEFNPFDESHSPKHFSDRAGQ